MLKVSVAAEKALLFNFFAKSAMPVLRLLAVPNMYYLRLSALA